MSIEEKVAALKEENGTIEKAIDCALHGLRKRVVDLHHHTIQHNDLDIDSIKVSIKELAFWNDVVAGLEVEKK